MFAYKTLGGEDIKSKLPYEELLNLYNIKGTTLHELGCSFGGRPIKGISTGDLSKPMFLIFNLHGKHEWRTPYWIIRFMRLVAENNNPYYRDVFTKLQSKFCLFVIPTINPDGYINNTRENDNGVDLNRNFDLDWETYPGDQYGGTKGSAPFSEPETKIIRDIVHEYKPILLVDCHTWGGGAEPTFELGSYLQHEVLFDDIVKSFNFAGMENPPFRVTKDNWRPKAGAWGAWQLNKVGQPIISLAIESAEKTTHYNQVKEGSDMLNLLCMYAVNYFETRNLIIN